MQNENNINDFNSDIISRTMEHITIRNTPGTLINQKYMLPVIKE